MISEKWNIFRVNYLLRKYPVKFEKKIKFVVFYLTRNKVNILNEFDKFYFEIFSLNFGFFIF